MVDQRCQICLGDIDTTKAGAYHGACCKLLFGASEPPELPYSWQDLNKLAERVVRRRVTVPGVQPKISLHLERRRSRAKRLTLVGMEGDYILKPPVQEYPEMPELEHLTLRLASLCGLETCMSGLVDLEDGRKAYITRRLDRVEGSKLHMEDMCQLTDRLTERKYSGSLEQVGKVVLTHCDNALYDALRFFELTIFCFLTGNADMHLKNFSLLYKPDGSIALSPAYDLLPTKLLLPEDKDESALAVSGKRRRLNVDDFMAFGYRIQLREKQLTNALERLSGRLPKLFHMLDRGFCTPKTKQRYRDLIVERAQRLGLDREGSIRSGQGGA